MSKKPPSTALSPAPKPAPFHLKRGISSGLTVYEETVSLLDPLVSQVRKTGSDHVRAKLQLGYWLAQIRARGHGELAMLKRLTTGPTATLGVRWSKSTMDRALEMFDKFLKDVGVSKKSLPTSEGGVMPDLFDKPPPNEVGELIKRMLEWSEDKGQAVAHDHDMTGDDAALNRTLPPAGPKREMTAAERREQDEADARAMLAQVQLWKEGETWKLLTDDELDQLRALGGFFHVECPKVVKQRRKN